MQSPRMYNISNITRCWTRSRSHIKKCGRFLFKREEFLSVYNREKLPWRIFSPRFFFNYRKRKIKDRNFMSSRFCKKQCNRGIKYLLKIRNLQYKNKTLTHFSHVGVHNKHNISQQYLWTNHSQSKWNQVPQAIPQTTAPFD